jgi:uncharacterized membrane protein
MKQEEGIIQKINHNSQSFGEKASDAISKWAGSWTFILSFIAFLVIWMILNAYAIVNAWDPYPFILLNLVLSSLAAFQAPIILMSQNRAAKKDRQRMEYDYAVNRKAEKGIESIQKKLNTIERKLARK